jgi:hypothetical protein
MTISKTMKSKKLSGTKIKWRRVRESREYWKQAEYKISDNLYFIGYCARPQFQLSCKEFWNYAFFSEPACHGDIQVLSDYIREYKNREPQSITQEEVSLLILKYFG